MQEELNEKGLSVGRSRVQHIMHQHGLKLRLKVNISHKQLNLIKKTL